MENFFTLKSAYAKTGRYQFFEILNFRDYLLERRLIMGKRWKRLWLAKKVSSAASVAKEAVKEVVKTVQKTVEDTKQEEKTVQKTVGHVKQEKKLKVFKTKKSKEK